MARHTYAMSTADRMERRWIITDGRNDPKFQYRHFTLFQNATWPISRQRAAAILWDERRQGSLQRLRACGYCQHPNADHSNGHCLGCLGDNSMPGNLKCVSYSFQGHPIPSRASRRVYR
jgi:hypothetical protein